jgi:hypothetical protein
VLQRLSLDPLFGAVSWIEGFGEGGRFQLNFLWFYERPSEFHVSAPEIECLG